MPAKIRSRLTFANVCSFLALLLAMSTSGAYAANTVFSTDIVNGQVKTPDLAPNAVVSAKILNGTVHAGDLAPNSVNGPKIIDGSVAGVDVTDESLTGADLAPNSVGASELASNAVTGAKVANESLTLADIAGASRTGSISLSGIANGRCNQVTFNVSGAQVGQVPLVATGAAIQNGIVLYAQRVASAGHVEVNACNFSGTSMTPISGFPVRVITFG